MENPYQAPQTTQTPTHGPAAPLTLKQILFTLQGRIPRRTYWLYTLLTMIPSYVLVYLLVPGLMNETLSASQPISPIAGILAFIVYVFMVWAGICIAGKR
jgi:uncharacterized membrane protein YhaH (DUF805 family)